MIGYSKQETEQREEEEEGAVLTTRFFYCFCFRKVHLLCLLIQMHAEKLICIDAIGNTSLTIYKCVQSTIILLLNANAIIVFSA